MKGLHHTKSRFHTHENYTYMILLSLTTVTLVETIKDFEHEIRNRRFKVKLWEMLLAESTKYSMSRCLVPSRTIIGYRCRVFEVDCK